MFEWLRFGRRKDMPSKDIAKERLRNVMLNDRVNLSPRLIGLIKADVAGVLRSYMDIEENGMTMTLARGEGARTRLTIEVPVLKVRNIGKNAY